MAEPSSTSANSSKVALVTGASGGIGRAVALRLAQDGQFLVKAVFTTNEAEQAIN